ncbi:hypothetical protein Godav_028289 [Gossypium davidsonii]|nr:hypothetical protein [Gossypium davidsonii]
MIQVTTFACGGIAIGTFLSHVIVDAPAAATFISSWVALTRKCGEEPPCLNFDASFVFPQSVAHPREATHLSTHLSKKEYGSRGELFLMPQQ